MSLQLVKYTESNMNIHLQIFPVQKKWSMLWQYSWSLKFSHFVCGPKVEVSVLLMLTKAATGSKICSTSIAAASVAKKAMRCSGVVRSAIHKANTTCASPVNETHGTVELQSTRYLFQATWLCFNARNVAENVLLKIIIHNAWERSTDHQAWTQHEAATTERA